MWTLFQRHSRVIDLSNTDTMQESTGQHTTTALYQETFRNFPSAYESGDAQVLLVFGARKLPQFFHLLQHYYLVIVNMNDNSVIRIELERSPQRKVSNGLYSSLGGNQLKFSEATLDSLIPSELKLVLGKFINTQNTNFHCDIKHQCQQWFTAHPLYGPDFNCQIFVCHLVSQLEPYLIRTSVPLPKPQLPRFGRIVQKAFHVIDNKVIYPLRRLVGTW